jgi:tetratricopeptide (TPR) repeat protein
MTKPIDIFISYTSANSSMAYRIYGDIVKMGGIAYLYEKERTLTNFENEIVANINNAKLFCYLDSSSARNAAYVVWECEQAYKKHLHREMDFVVLLVEPEGAWRNSDGVFNEINKIRYLDLGLSKYNSNRDKSYDFQEDYYNALRTICQKVSLDFVMPVPNAKDFSNELNILNLHSLEQEILVNDFQVIQYRYGSKHANIESRLKFLMADCDLLKLQVISPGLLLGSILLQNGALQEAYSVYHKITTQFEDDPRGWVGCSRAAFHLKNHECSLQAIARAEELARKDKNNPKIFNHYSNIVHNKIKLLVMLNRFDEARATIESIKAIRKEILILPEFRILRLSIEIQSGNFRSLKEEYDALVQFFRTNEPNRNDALILAELEYNIAKFYCSKEDFENAIVHFENAIAYDHHNIIYHSELALLYYAIGDQEEKIYMLSRNFENWSPEGEQDFYYFGLLKYLSGEFDEAKQLYLRSRALNFQYYDQLIQN